ncbi:MAG TPA: GAF domain-containing protein, partial [Geothrix sp.]|nr:GAF domain-containing protein [Geothrix sp.]
NAREAAKVAALYGAGTAAKVIPQPGAGVGFLEGEMDLEVAGAKPDGMLQLRILRELSSLLEGKADSSIVMELVLEGIYRGIGMDRTLFALLTPDRSELRTKFMLGAKREQLADHFHFRMAGATHVFGQVLEKQAALWVDAQIHPEQERLLPMEVVSVTGRIPFFVAPIVVNDRSIGLFYADRGVTGRPLDEESYESFRHFAQQASLGLSHLAKRGRH